MNSKSLRQMAVLSVDIVDGWASAHIPQVGIFKPLAKKRADYDMYMPGGELTTSTQQ